MSNQTPSIGRIVHYHHPSHKQPLPAVINYIDPENPNHVGLYVMSPSVGGYTADAIRQGNNSFEWNWPPYVPAPKPDPKPVPTIGDVVLLLNKHFDATPLEVHRAAEELMELFEDFL